MKPLLVLSGIGSRIGDRNLAAMAAHLGASAQVQELTEECPHSGTPLLSWRNKARAGLALHADTLAALYRNERDTASLREQLLATDALFLHGVAPNAHDEAVGWLTGGLVTGADAMEGSHCELPRGGSRFTRQLAGSQFTRHHPSAAVLVCADRDDTVQPLMTVSGAPTFVCVEQNGCRVFISTAPVFPDPNHRVTKEEDIEAFYETLLPLMIFVRSACEPYCWHGPESAARLIIDDPVLRRTYGYLDFGRLFESLHRHQYATSVAYIPWNQPRTSKKYAAFFGAAGAPFSLCVHGCDHTNNEYGSPDEEHLRHKSQRAMERMTRHQDRTGIAFEPVMVFPQGRFSTASLRALRSAGFMAAINSTRFPVDADAAPVSLWQLLQPAIDRPYGFPVFGRHYVEPTFPFLLDLFLGRPAFAVEHHEFFKDGFPVLEALVDRLNECAPAVSWRSLSETVTRACWKRALSPTSWEVRFYTDRFSLTNDSDLRITYRLMKYEPKVATVTGLSIDGCMTQPDRNPELLVYELSLNPGQSACIEVHRSASSSRALARDGKLYAGKVLVRRMLSEFRDEFLVKHPVMLTSAKRIVSALKATSDSLPSPGTEQITSR